MLALTVSVGELNSGVAVSDDATGEGFIMYSEASVHERFENIGTDNADHFIAVRLDGLQWQYNDDSQWLDFEPQLRDALVAEVNFGSDFVQNGSITIQPRHEGIWFRHSRYYEDPFREIDLRVVANQFGGEFDEGEFTILGSTFQITEYEPLLLSQMNMNQIATATASSEYASERFPGLANFDTTGNPLLSWRVHLLPQLGYGELYQQFRLDEPWDSAHNLPLAEQMPDVFRSPNFGSTNRTPYLAIAGDDTAFALDGTPFDWDYTGQTRMPAFVEVDAAKAVVWTSPVDWYYDASDPLAGIGNAGDYGFVIAEFNQRVLTLPRSVDATAFANYVDVTNDSPVDYEALGANLQYRPKLYDVPFAILSRVWQYQKHEPLIRAADDTPLLSWRVGILPQLGYRELYDQFRLDEPWDSAHNIALLPLMPEEFRHPDLEDGKTVLLGLDAPGSIFDSTRISIPDTAFFDGFDNTISIVEADLTEAVEWTRPVDLLWDENDPFQGLGSLRDDGRFDAALMSGSAHSFATDKPESLAAWVSVDGREVNDYSIVSDDHWRWFTAAKLSHLSNAFYNYEYANQEFPRTIYDTETGDGTPLLSWRVRILPYIEQQNLYDQFRLDEPWDSPHNLSLLPLMPAVFRTPGVENGKTVFQGAHGENTLFRDSNTAVTFGDLTNIQEMIGIMQVSSEHAIEWTKPGDFNYDPATIRSWFEDDNTSGFHVSIVDGLTRFIDDTVSDDVLNRLVSPADYADSNIDVSAVWANDLPWYYRSRNSLQRVSYAALDYQSANSHYPGHATYSLPQGGTPLLSWRVELLPFLGYEELYNKFHHDEPWDSDHNLSLVPLMPQIYRHTAVENGKTTFQALTTAWDPSAGLESMFPLTNDIKVSYGSITDGTPNTIMFVASNPEDAVVWTKPEDILFDAADPTAGFDNGTWGNGSWVSMADGATRFVSMNMKHEPIALAVSPTDGEFIDLFDDNNFYYGVITPEQVCYIQDVLVRESDGSTFVSESGSTDAYEIVLNSTPDTNVTITIDPGLQLDVGNGTGQPLTLVFTPANALTPQTVTVATIDDDYDEGLFIAQIQHIVTSEDGAYNGMPVNNITAMVSDNDHLPTPASPVLNEVYVDDNDVNADLEFVEILSEPSAPLTDLWLIGIDGNGQNSGLVSFAQDLSSITAGSNGLTLLGSDYAAFNPWSSETHSGTTVADLNDGFFAGGTRTYVLLEGFEGELGDELDSTGNGRYDALPWSRIFDSIGWNDGGSDDLVYTPAHLMQSGTPEAATRIYGENQNDSFPSWFNGIIAGAGSNVAYGTGSSNIPTGAVLTPGAANFGATTPSLTSDSISFGGEQRSSITELTLSFEGWIEFDSDAFSVIQRTDGSGNSTSDPVALSVTDSIVDGNTTVTITFDDLTRAGSEALVDGNYQLTVDGSKVRRMGTDLSMGSNFVYGDSADETFYSLFGDDNADRRVNVIDLLGFRKAYNSSIGDSDYVASLDNNSDGSINVLDLLRFRQNYLEELPFA